MKLFWVALMAFLVLAADVDANDKRKQKKRQRQREHAERLLMNMQNLAFPVDDWLKVGPGCCRVNGDDALYANEQDAVCDSGGEDEIVPMKTLQLEKRADCRKECEDIACCVAYEWRPRASSYNCDLFNSSVYPDSCSENSLLCSGASCWKKNLALNDMVKLTEYTYQSPDGCCRGNNITVISSLPLLDSNKKKKHDDACQNACDLVPGCDAVESVFSDTYTARCELFNGKPTWADKEPAACTEASCMVKQCPGDLSAIMNEVPLFGGEEEKDISVQELESANSHSSSDSDDSGNETVVLSVVAIIVGLVVAVMGLVAYLHEEPPSLVWYTYFSKRSNKQTQLSPSAVGSFVDEMQPRVKLDPSLESSSETDDIPTNTV